MIDPLGNQVSFQGLTTLNNVEFFRMGQHNNFKAAIRFEGSNLASTGTTSSVEGCVVHDSSGWGLSVKSSSNILLKSIDVFSAVQIGVSLDSTKNVKADSVNVFGVASRGETFGADKECCFAMCSFTSGIACTGTNVTNSIVAGCPYAGFIAPGYSCNDPVGNSKTNVFKDNVAHSVKGSGFCVFPDVALADKKTCYQGSDFKAYKNEEAGIGVMPTTDEVRFSNIVSVDNTLGISINLSGETDNEKKSIFKDSFVYGESSDLAKDCPDGSGSATGASCFCHDKIGHMSAQITRQGKSPHNNSRPSRPVYMPVDYATWNSRSVVTNVAFSNFISELTSCGAK